MKHDPILRVNTSQPLAPMFRYRLRTLLIVLALGPALLAGTRGCARKPQAAPNAIAGQSRLDRLTGLDPSPQLLQGDWEDQQGAGHPLHFEAGVWPGAPDD